MPKLVRLYIRNVLIGFAIAFGFVSALVWLDIANLHHLILETRNGWLAFAMMVMANGVVFAGVQFAIAVMQMAEDPGGPTRGSRAPVTRRRGHGEMIPIAATAPKSQRSQGYRP
jgi:hypothetical protein